jgi:Deoxyribonuclease II
MRTNRIFRALVSSLAVSLLLAVFPGYAPVAEPTVQQSVPAPLIATGQPVDWWFVFKLNSGNFPDCGGAKKACPFGGTVQNYKDGQQYVFASNESPTLKQGSGCVGTTGTDPLGATFEQVYNGSFNYLIWNDQFYDDPKIAGCTKECGAPWGHSKGMLVWNDAGNGFVMQVSTPSWPAAGNKTHPRKTDGNTLGCVDDDDVKVSQHFFALKLNKDDLVNVLKALQNASIVTDPTNPQIVNNGGPSDVQALVNAFGKKSTSTTFITTTLSSGVQLISKPSKLNVPPWQMVSAILGGVDLRAATWWASPPIPTTTASTPIKCWDKSLSKPGAVQIATTGNWNGKTIGLKGISSPNGNHAKIGVSLPGSDKSFAIFGDMNQQGSLSGPSCKSSQNGRGGLFFVIDNKELNDSVSALIKGTTAATTLPKKKPAR